jgi:hypothetical protein
MTELDRTSDYYEQMNWVVQRLLKGETNPTAIARETGLTRKQVLDFVDEWKSIAQNHPDIQARARESLTAFDRHTDMLIKEMWSIVDVEIDNKIRATVLKNIADIEFKRQETLQKAGLFDDSGIADQIAEMEQTAEAIEQFLGEIAKKFPETRTFIMEGLHRIFGSGVSVDTENDVIKGEIE